MLLFYPGRWASKGWHSDAVVLFRSAKGMCAQSARSAGKDDLFSHSSQKGTFAECAVLVEISQSALRTRNFKMEIGDTCFDHVENILNLQVLVLGL